jgi:hypothetical protein
MKYEDRYFGPEDEDDDDYPWDDDDEEDWDDDGDLDDDDDW